MAKEYRQKTVHRHSPRQKSLPRSRQKMLNATRTDPDFVREAQEHELLPDSLAEDGEYSADDATGDLPAGEIAPEEDNEWEDDYIDPDEPGAASLLEAEDINFGGRTTYVVDVNLHQGDIRLAFADCPYYTSSDVQGHSNFLEKLSLLMDIAATVTDTQKECIVRKDLNQLRKLNQKDVLEEINKKKQLNLSRAHMSRLLSALYLNIDGIGILPAKCLFRRYGSKSKLNSREKREYAIEFLKAHRDNSFSTKLEEAKNFVQWLGKEKKSSVSLPDSKNEHDRYKTYLKCLRDARKELPNDQ